jgi:hypothetical protein
MAPAVAAARAALGRCERWTGDDDLVFGGEVGGYLDGSARIAATPRPCSVRGLRPLRFHDLGHTSARA